MVDYLYKVGDIVVIASGPTFLKGKTGYIKDYRESLSLVGEGGLQTRDPAYTVHLFHENKWYVFLEDQLEVIS